MLDGIDLHVVFHEMHRSIEEAASAVARDFMEGVADLTYPPNHGLLPDELEALASLPRTAALEGALRKLIADAAAYPLFHLLSLADGIVDAPELDDVQPGERIAGEIMLHDGLYASYWSWRRRRPDPGWRLDTYEGE